MTRHSFLPSMLSLLLFWMLQILPFTNAQEICAAEKQQYANCVFRLQPPLLGKQCDDCRISTFDNLVDLYDGDDLGESCSDVSNQLCSAVFSCGCQDESGLDCKDELEELWACTTRDKNATCDMDCFTTPSPTETGPLCPNDFDRYKTCVLDDLPQDQGGFCDDCRLRASEMIPEEATCSQVEEIFCNAVYTCGCNQCAGALQSYLNCDVYKRWFGECQVDCTTWTATADLGQGATLNINGVWSSGATITIKVGSFLFVAVATTLWTLAMMC